MLKTYINNFVESDPEFTVQYGSLSVFVQNGVFIKESCKAAINRDNCEDFLLISKNQYLIGVVVYEKYSNSYLMYPSKNACVFSIVNLIEITLLYLTGINTQDCFNFLTLNSIADQKIYTYFNDQSNTTTNLNLEHLKQDKLDKILKRYDQLLWI